jgi:hypothetical protein
VGLICPNNKKITKIYFENGSKESSIGGYGVDGLSAGFYNLNQLKYVYFAPSMNETVKVLGQYSFFYDSELTKIDNLPDSIETIEAGAFFNASKLELTKLPLNIKTIAEQAFGSCSNLSIDTFGYNPAGSPSGNENHLTTIGPRAFENSLKNVDSITINKSVKSIGSECFAGSQNDPRLTVNDYTGTLDVSYFGNRSVVINTAQEG